MKSKGDIYMRTGVLTAVLFVFAFLFPVFTNADCAAAYENETAPDFSMSDLHGTNHSLSSYRGKVVVINFWASWCPECVEELSSLNALYEKFRERGLIVLGITVDKSREVVDPVIRRSNVTYPVILNTAGSSLLRQYRLIGLPNTVVIDRSGVIAARTIGRTDFMSQDFIKQIESLLGTEIKK
jgi:peroxiredoxin